jgi:hypothetical protein
VNCRLTRCCRLPACLPACLPAGDHPPSDEEGFQAFIASLSSPYIAEMLEVPAPAHLLLMSHALWCTWHSRQHVLVFLLGKVYCGLAKFTRVPLSPCAMLQGAEALTPVSKYAGTRNQRRQFEKVRGPCPPLLLCSPVRQEYYRRRRCSNSCLCWQ